METLLLRDSIKEAIKDRTVVAAVFHTFNFDSVFFENFVMPIFVPSKEFNNEAIYNKILWRNCAKENLIPPIAVFIDYYAKDNSNAPSLGYDIHCIKVPASKGFICNFHPKHIFILVKDATGKQSLLLVTASSNLTPSGWCDNIECVSIKELIQNKTVPNRTTTNSLQDYLASVGKLIGLNDFLPAEILINEFLRYVDFNEAYFNSFDSSFNQFLEGQNIFADNIVEVEIISPYYSPDVSLVKYLQSKNINSIKCLIPTFANNEIMLAKDIFLLYKDAGIDWCFWKVKDVDMQTRNLHSKIYKFYGSKYCYTFIGSVNFTKPAWAGYLSRNNKGNIESGLMYFDKPSTDKLLIKPNNFQIAHWSFMEKEEKENPSLNDTNNRNAPNLQFEIDWQKQTLSCVARLVKTACNFYDMLDKLQIENGKKEYPLGAQQLEQFAKNTIIKVAIKINETVEIYTYYPNQINIENKPLGFKLNAATVLKYWQFLDDDIGNQALTRSYVQAATDESGIVDESKIETKLLLNEMASHFAGLVNLEKLLFNRKLQTKNEKGKEKVQHFDTLKYYLLSENIDTIKFYLNDLKEQLAEAKIQKSFYWIIIQIVCKVIFSKAEKWEYRNAIDKVEWKKFKNNLNFFRDELEKNATNIEKEIPELKQKSGWILEQLVTEYD